MASFKFGSGIASANILTPNKLSANLTGTMACIKRISHKEINKEKSKHVKWGWGDQI